MLSSRYTPNTGSTQQRNGRAKDSSARECPVAVSTAKRSSGGMPYILPRWSIHKANPVVNSAIFSSGPASWIAGSVSCQNKSGISDDEQQIRKLAEPKSEPLMIFYSSHFLKILNFAGKYILFGSILTINLPINFIVNNSFIGIYNRISSAKTGQKSISNRPPILYGKPNILEPICSYGLKGQITHFSGSNYSFETRKNAGRRNI